MILYHIDGKNSYYRIRTIFYIVIVSSAFSGWILNEIPSIVSTINNLSELPFLLRFKSIIINISYLFQYLSRPISSYIIFLIFFIIFDNFIWKYELQKIFEFLPWCKKNPTGRYTGISGVPNISGIYTFTNRIDGIYDYPDDREVKNKIKNLLDDEEILNKIKNERDNEFKRHDIDIKINGHYENEGKLEITQTWSGMTVRFISLGEVKGNIKKTETDLVAASLNIKLDYTIELYFFYKKKNDLQAGAGGHGANYLQFTEEGISESWVNLERKKGSQENFSRLTSQK
jgi:hypothetical protein